MEKYNVNTFFDKIFYINMDKDTDRNQHILKQFARAGITNFERFPGISIPDDHPWLVKNGLFMTHKYTDPIARTRYIRGSLGCTLSHRGIISAAKERRYNRILILEDDVYFADNFGEKFAEYMSEFDRSVGHWNMMYLGMRDWQGGVYNTVVPNTSNKIYKINSGGYCAFAYAFQAQDNVFQYIIDNIDYTQMEIDLLYNSLNMKNCINTYKFAEDIIIDDGRVNFKSTIV